MYQIEQKLTFFSMIFLNVGSPFNIIIIILLLTIENHF